MTPLLQTLLESSLRISVVAGAVGLFLVVARVRSSELRHKAWAAVLAAMLLMPALPRLVPPLRVPVRVTAELPPIAPLPDSAAMQAEAAPVAQSAPAARVWSWMSFAMSLYAAVLLAMLVRLLAGWIAVRKLLRMSRRVERQCVFESDFISTPLTVGLLRPSVLLPCEWKEWPGEKLSAVLAHEFAHVARRDTLIGFVAHVNRCVFWFHPLAWWLERHLAAVAEQACDDAGIRAVGGSRKYAEVLLDMAETAARAGQRISWQGVGVDGTGMLGARIDRVLRGGALLGKVTRRQKWFVALGCSAAILVAAACRQSVYSPPKDNPDDVRTRNRLVMAYRDRKDMQERAAPHEIWLAEYRPEEENAWAWAKLLPPASLERMKAIWGATAERKNASGKALANAALFFQWQVKDVPRAEAILARLHARAGNPEWARRLGSLYGRVLLGRDYSPAFVAGIRAKLSESQDAAVLAATGLFIEARQGWPRGAKPESAHLADDYVGRALKLDPTSADVRYAMEIRRLTEHNAKMAQALGHTGGISHIEEQYSRLRKLSEAERFEYLPDLAQRAYSQGETSDYWHDNATGARFMALSQTYAQELLSICSSHSGEPGYAIAFHRANMILGGTAMRLNGDKGAALKYLASASTVPQPRDASFSSTQRLLSLLLRSAGPEGRNAVLEYCEREGRALGADDPGGLAKLAEQLRKS